MPKMYAVVRQCVYVYDTRGLIHLYTSCHMLNIYAVVHQYYVYVHDARVASNQQTFCHMLKLYCALEWPI